MQGAQTYRPSGTAEPRFGWSGVAQLILPLDREQELISAARLLPSTKSSLESIVSELLELGARYVRYLHQDEFGPTRAERLAALRRLLGQTRSILCHLNALPEPLRIHLSSRLAFNETFRQLIQEPDRSDVLNPLSMELLYEAAVDVEACLPRAQAAESAKLMTSLAVVARETMEMLRSVDTSTASDLMLDAVCQRPPLPSADAGSADPLMLLGAGMIELSRCLKQTLDRLKRRGGPELRASLRGLVWQLCDLWKFETGQDVTSNAKRAGDYTSVPQSPAGKFVWAVVKALQPSPAWLQEHQYWDLPVRARIIAEPEQGLPRAIHLEMRGYVAQHPTASRRGRRKGRRATP